MIQSLLLFLFLMTGLPPPAPVTFSLVPTQANSPAVINAKITIQPDYLSRQGCIEWDSPEGEAGKHCWPQEGQYAYKTTWFQIFINTPGNYKVVAFVVRVSDTLYATPQTVIIN